MNKLEQFEQLVGRARQETPPVVDVTTEVLSAVRVVRGRRVDSVDRMAVLFAAVSVLAALIVAMVAWRMLEEPMVAEVPNPFVVPVMASQ